LRANVKAGTPLGLEAREYMDRGELAPDELTSAMVAARLDDEDMTSGWLLDGFPRNLVQAKWLDTELASRGMQLTSVIFLNAPDDVVIERMLLRARADDTAEAMSTRLAIYRTETLPMLQFFERYVVEVDGVGHLQEVQHRILSALGRSDLVHG
jgi:adenylate kinase